MTVAELDFDFLRLTHVAQLYPERVTVFPMVANLLDLARKNRKRDAYAKVQIPDEWVKALQGPPEQQPLVYFVHIPRELIELSTAPLILPTVGAERADRLILPGGR